jgi:hypothetical protein
MPLRETDTRAKLIDPAMHVLGWTEDLYQHERWFATLPPPATATLKALTDQFAHSGTHGLENPQVFDTPEMTGSGGLAGLKARGRPAEILRQTKERLFAA